MSNYISKYLNSIRKQYLYINSCNILQNILISQELQPQSYRVMGTWVTGITGLYNSRVIRLQPLAGFRDTTPELQSYGRVGYRYYRVIQLQGYKVTDPCMGSEI